MTSLPNFDKGFGLERESDYSNDPKKKKYDRNMIFGNQKIQEISIDTGDASLDKSGGSIMNKKRKTRLSKRFMRRGGPKGAFRCERGLDRLCTIG